MIFAGFVAVLAGVSIVVSRIINANLGDKIGVFSSTFFNYIVGFSISLIILLFTNEVTNIPTLHLNEVPFLGYLGGFLGVMVVSLSSFVAPKTSAFYMTLFCFVGQLFVGIFIDYASMGALSIGKIIGGILVFIGLAYNINIDKKASDIKTKVEIEQTITN